MRGEEGRVRKPLFLWSRSPEIPLKAGAQKGTVHIQNEVSNDGFSAGVGHRTNTSQRLLSPEKRAVCVARERRLVSDCTPGSLLKPSQSEAMDPAHPDKPVLQTFRSHAFWSKLFQLQVNFISVPRLHISWVNGGVINSNLAQKKSSETRLELRLFGDILC